MCTGTLAGAEVTDVGRATCVDGGTEVAFWMACSKMRANFWISWIWASPIWAKGGGMELVRALVRARVALTAASEEELCGTGQSW